MLHSLIPPRRESFANFAASRATPHFTWGEFACKGCTSGCARRTPVVNVQPEAVAKLEVMRRAIGRPFRILSACRCPEHNARIGGARNSRHIATPQRPSSAFDIALAIPGTGGVLHDKRALIEAAEDAGFRGLGTQYRSFLHVDARKHPARW